MRKATCFAFAGAVFLEGLPLSVCAKLTEEEIQALQAKLSGAEDAIDDRLEQAVDSMLKEWATRNSSRLPREAGPTVGNDSLIIDFLGSPVVLSPRGISRDEAPLAERTAFVLLSCLLQDPRPETPNPWSTYLELPDTGGTVNCFNRCTQRIAKIFGSKLAAFDRAAHVLGGQAIETGSTERAYVFSALPDIRLLLKYWNGEEDPEARALVDHPTYGRFASLSDFGPRAEIRFNAGAAHLGPKARLLLVEELVDQLAAI